MKINEKSLKKVVLLCLNVLYYICKANIPQEVLSMMTTVAKMMESNPKLTRYQISIALKNAGVTIARGRAQTEISDKQFAKYKENLKELTAPKPKAEKKATTKKPTAKKPGAVKAKTAKTISAKKPSAKKPTAKKPTAKKPEAAHAHSAPVAALSDTDGVHQAI